MTVLIFKFIGDRTDVAYLQTWYNPLRGLNSLQIGNIGSISDKLENLNSHFLSDKFLWLMTNEDIEVIVKLCEYLVKT
jgi:hypothetical protein